MHRVGIVGAGFAGAVLARQLAESGRFECFVFDGRDHIGGNCHTYRDDRSKIMIHAYGPHIFNTSNEEVWTYIQRFGVMQPFINRVKAVTKRGLFSLPINLHTINQFFGKTMNPQEAEAFVRGLGDSSIAEPRNFEEQALKFLGREIYDHFFYGYTKKQWGVEPTELPASILKRLPVRFNYNDNYYNQKYQGIPEHGYTAIVEKILDHPRISVKLKTKCDRSMLSSFEHVFTSGALDDFFDYEFGDLSYRGLDFEKIETEGDYQGNAVINYCEERIPFTRIHEHKHFAPWESHDQTVCFREYSKSHRRGETPYYPMRLEKDKLKLSSYVKLAEETGRITFMGRLGTYRYLDMHVVIEESLNLSKLCLSKDVNEWPRFSVNPVSL